jgi:competence protein ComEC
LPLAHIITGKPAPLQLIFYLLALITSIILLSHLALPPNERESVLPLIARKNYLLKLKNKKHILLSSFLLVLATFVISHPFAHHSNLLEINMLDVGQGDGIFIKTKNELHILIDGGSTSEKEAGRNRIEPFLKYNGVSTIDYVFISHGDLDHINGIYEMIVRENNGIKIKNLVLTSENTWDENLITLANTAKQHNINVLTMTAGEKISDGNFSLTSLFPTANINANCNTNSPNDTATYNNTTHAYSPISTNNSTVLAPIYIAPGNDTSMIVSLHFHEFDMLFTGDIGNDSEKLLTDIINDELPDTSWEVLKVAHHGSKNSSSDLFLYEILPTHSIISAGIDNRYHHPSSDTIDRLREIESNTLCTQDTGTITIKTDGTHMSTTTYLVSPSPS